MKYRGAQTSLLPFPETFYSTIADQIYTPIRMGESVALILPPFFGKDYLLHYLRERTIDRERIFGKNMHKYFWQHVLIRSAENDETKEWIEQLSVSIPGFQKKHTTLESFFTLLRKTLEEESKHVVFVVNISEDIKLSALQRFFHLANKTLYALPNSVHFILAIEQTWDDTSFSNAIAPFSSLFQHTVRPAHRTDEEIRHFIQYRLQVWNHTITDNAINLIVNEAGGMPLLAKAAVRIATREALTTPGEIQGLIKTHPDYQDRIKLFWQSLTPDQQSLLKTIATNSGEIDKKNATQLLRIDIIRYDSATKVFGIRSKSLHRFLAGDTIISVQDVADRASLSPQENALFSALSSPIGGIVTREAAATILWGAQAASDYSDWALDKVISRMRQKLAVIKGQEQLSLVSKKKSGVYLQLL